LRFRFGTKKLYDLYTQGKGARKYPPEAVEAFFEVMAVIAAARDERDLYALSGLHYEKLSGARTAEKSLRLTRQWRLVVAAAADSKGPYLLVKDIEDYHR